MVVSDSLVTVAASAPLQTALDALHEEFRVVVAPDLGTGLREAKRHRAVLVVDASSLAEGDLRRATREDLPSIALVANDAQGMQAIQAGATEYLTDQDLRPEVVRSAILSALRHAGAASELREQLRREYRTRLEETVDEMRSSLVRRLGDRYRAPVEDLRRALDVLGAERMGPPAQEALAQLHDVAGRLEELAKQTSIAFDVVSGSMGGRNARFDLAELLQNIIDGYQRKVAKDGGRIEAALVPVMMQGDPQSTAEVLEAFIRNASRAVMGGVIVIRIEAQSDTVTIEIHDDALSRDFTQLRAAMEPGVRAMGDGLGDLSLFAARRLLGTLGGQVHVRPSRDHGSTVVVEMPRTRPAGGGATVQVLHVEDEDDDRVILQAVVRRLGLPLHVEGVSTLAEARKRLAEGGIDIIFLDMHLPDATMEQVLEALHQWSQWLPVVALTGDADRGLAREALDAGSRDFIKKAHLTDQAVLTSLMRSALVSRNIMQAVNRG